MMRGDIITYKNSPELGILESYWNDSGVSMIRMILENGKFIVSIEENFFKHAVMGIEKKRIIKKYLQKWNSLRFNSDLSPIGAIEAFYVFENKKKKDESDGKEN